ncbi:MAG: hypothetical protein HY554_05945 [Elusimicrobia bacterium]|nr:hypothetical protein [Elusimicrobiota bacterium]
MARIEPTRALALTVWWAFIWRAVLGAVGAGFAIGLALGLLAQLGVLGQRALENLSAFFGLAVGLLVSVEVMYRVLRKRFKDFEIALVSREEA